MCLVWTAEGINLQFIHGITEQASAIIQHKPVVHLSTDLHGNMSKHFPQY
jgi:hypothetical protein